MDIARQRLVRSFLNGSPFTAGREVVRTLGAVQAQDYDGAKWALAQRTRAGMTDQALEQEFAAGHIVRTHVLRPTWHFVDPLDIRWMLALTGPRIMASMAPYNRHLELDAATFRRTNAAIAKALRDGKSLTRAELKAVLGETKPGTLGVQRVAHIMMQAELEALICSGPRRGRESTYALLDERVPAAPPLERDEALLKLTRCYFRTRAPATAQDFSWWSGLKMADVRRGIDLARSELESATIDGVEYWSNGDPPARPKPLAHMLPNYDELFIGYRDRSAMGQRLKSVKAVTGGSALIANVIFMDAQLVGGWRRSPGKDAIRLKVEILAPLNGAEEKRLMAEVRRYESFLGKPVELHRTSRPTRVRNVSKR